MPNISAARVALAEFVATAFLVAAVVGSGIMAERLSGGNGAIALLANSIATGAVLVTLIFTFGPISGAHLNPVVTLAAALERAVLWRTVPAYVVAQVTGALAGLFITHAMFDLPLVQAAARARPGFPQLLSEFVATFGLLVVVHGTGKRVSVVPLTVGAYITGAYWFTSSTAFANPAVTVARGFTATFTGIRLSDVPGFIAAQILAAVAATFFMRALNVSTDSPESP